MQYTSTCGCVQDFLKPFLAALKKKDEIFQRTMTHLDFELIRLVKKKRVERGLTQLDLSIAMGLSEGTVGKIENFRERSKYNIRHLNLLAKAFKCPLRELLPSLPVEHDLVKITFAVDREKKNRNDNEDYYRVIRMEPVKPKK